jgi:outer membrane protein OmpA-like peptidoglycan-associated protein
MAGVTFIDHVPSVAEIAQAWRPTVAIPATTVQSTNDARRPTLKMRGIEWQPPDSSGAKPPADEERPALALPVAFDSGLSKVSRPSLPYVAAVASALAQDPGISLIVEGHTDAAGSPRANLVLSWERAFAVFRLLVERHGIDPARLTLVGKGCAEPLDSTPLPNPRNRRVQFRIASS